MSSHVSFSATRTLARTRRTLLRSIAWVLLWPAMAAHAQADLRLAVLPSLLSMPIYVAESQHYFEAEGVKVHTVNCAGRNCLQQLLQGKVDLATASELLMVTEDLGPTPPAIIATMCTSAKHVKLLARRSAGIERPADFRGRRVGTVKGSSAEYYLDSWLVYHDVDPKTVQVVGYAPGQLAQALQRREVDAISIWEPIINTAASALGKDAVPMLNPRLYKNHFNLVASRHALTEREAALVKVLRALERAQRFIASSPAQSLKIMAARVPAGSREQGVAEHDFALLLEQSLVVTMDGEARWAAQQEGTAPMRPANVMQRIDPAPLRKAVEGAVSLVQ